MPLFGEKENKTQHNNVYNSYPGASPFGYLKGNQNDLC